MTSEDESICEEDSILSEKSISDGSETSKDEENDIIINNLEIFINKTTAIPLDLVMKQIVLRITACNSESGKKVFQSLITNHPQTVDNFILSWKEKVLVQSLDEKSVIFFEFLEQNSGNLYSSRYFCDSEWIYLCWAVFTPPKQYEKIFLQLNKFRKRVQSSNVFYHWKKWSTKPVADTKLEISTRNYIGRKISRTLNETVGFPGLSDDQDLARSFSLKDNVKFIEFHPYKSLIGVVLKNKQNVVNVMNLSQEISSMELKGHEDSITSFQWYSKRTHEYDLLLSLSEDKSVIVWELHPNTYTMKFVIPHIEPPLSASIIWTSNGIESYMLITGSNDGELRVWSCNSEGLHFLTELNGPESDSIINIFPISKTSFMTIDKKGVVFEWKRKLKKESWKGKHKYTLIEDRIGKICFSKIYNQGLFITSKGLKVFDILSGKPNTLIEKNCSIEVIDQIYIDDEGLNMFYVVFDDSKRFIKCYNFKDKSMNIISSEIGTEQLISMSFHLRLGLFAVVLESGSINFLEVPGCKKQSKKRPSFKFHRNDISNLDKILKDLDSYICGDIDVPLNRFPSDNLEPRNESCSTNSASVEEEEINDRTFSISSKEDGRTYSISKASEEDSD